MDKPKALDIVKEFKLLAEKQGLWITVVTEGRPQLRMIRIQEISIKVESE